MFFIKWQGVKYISEIFSCGLGLTRSLWVAKVAEQHRILRKKPKCWEEEAEKPSFTAYSAACKKCNQTYFFFIAVDKRL